MTQSTDFCILGAGLAGLSTALELQKRGYNVSIVDNRHIGGGASGTPLGLANPATGRYATKTWEAEACYDAILSNLELVSSFSGHSFFQKTGVLRPALDQKIAGRMQENVNESDWPDDWCEWLEPNSLRSLNSNVVNEFGGVWLPVGMTVDVGSFMNQTALYLQDQGSRVYLSESYELNPVSDGWEIIFSDGNRLQANNVIITSGVYSAGFEYWKHIKLHPVKGQLAIIEPSKPIDFNHAVSALGYAASFDSKTLVLGSTYEHKFEDERPDDQGLDYILKRFEKVFPNLSNSYQVIDQWSGVRASTPNRKPIIGTHPTHKNLHVYAGLGSKGLLYSGYCAQLFSEYLINGSALPDEFSADRFQS
jgi:glycine/D-amino acid oxidase-like deaminating enzyme